jgi:two-component system nitrate/nitrite response regulator NarL
MSGPPSVVIASADGLVRSVISEACAARDIEVVAEVASASSLVNICAETAPSVVVCDSVLHDGPVEPFLPGVIAHGSRVLIVCQDRSTANLVALLGAGASGWLHQDLTPDEVVTAIEIIASGDSVLDPHAATTILQEWRRLRAGGDRVRDASLTARESQVLSAMVDGMPTKTIAAHLGMAFKTVENHKIRIFQKLGVRTHAQAISFAIGHGLVRLSPPAAPETA